MDNAFCEVSAAGLVTSWGTVANDALPVTMAASPQQLLLGSGGSAYVFDLTANVLTQIPAATFSGPVAQVGICDDFFLVTIKNTKLFYVSAPLDANDYVTNGSAIVSVFPDNIVSMAVVHREIFFQSDTKSVWYYDSGNIFPFDVVPGSDMDQGTAAEFSTVLLDNTAFWLGADERGHGKVFRANGYVPQRVSNHALEFAIQSYSRMDDCVCFSYQDQGHDFYVMCFSTASVNWVYDVATSMWHQRGSWQQINGTYQALPYQCHTFNFGKHLVGDSTQNLIYEMHVPFQNPDGSWSFATENGALIHRLRRAPHISSEQKRQHHSQLQVYVETGIGPVPPLSGDTPPLNVLLQDPNGVIWALGVSDVGVLTTDPGSGLGQLLFLNSTDGTTSWRVTVDIFGVLSATLVPFNSFYPQSLPLSNSSGLVPQGMISWNVQVSPIGNLLANLGGSYVREPKMSLRYSSDGAHSWSDYITRGCGQIGEYKKRVLWKRLGMPRDFNIEITMSDPIGWRVVDAYLDSTPGSA